MKFHDWDEDFEITSGEEIVIRANQKQFNSIIYDLQQLIRETYRYNEDSDPLILKNHKVQWYDRESNGHEIDYTIKSTMANEAFSVSISMVYDGIAYDWAFNSQIDEKIELKEIVKDVEVRLSYDRKRIDYSVWRKDIEQGMWQNQ
jgi:hypothetical protein